MGDFVICANDIAGIDSGSTFNSAFSFQNYLQDTITLPPNCEVAVQSVKINRSGQLTVSRDSDWGFYFGTEIPDAAERNLTTSICKRVKNDITQGAYYAGDITDALKKMINAAMKHPEIFGKVTVETTTDSNGVFTGFKIKYGQLPKHDGTNDLLDIKQTIQNVYKNRPRNGLTYNELNQRLTAVGAVGTAAVGPDTNFNIGQLITAPLCLNNGYMQVNVEDLREGGTNGTSSWAVGISRSIEDRLGFKYFDFDASDVYEIREHYFDFVVAALQVAQGSERYLRVYHAIKNPDDPTGQTVTMKEIPYYLRPGNRWEGIGPAPATGKPDKRGCNWSRTMGAPTASNPPKKGKALRFYINNEVVHCDMNFEDSAGDGSDVAEWIPLVTNILTDDPVVDKGFYFKPICDSCRMLYPRLWIKKGGSHMVLQNLRQRHVDALDSQDYTVASYGMPRFDYFAEAQKNNDLTNVIDLDTRFYNDYTNATTYQYRGIDTNDVAEDYVFGMLFTDNIYGAPWTLSGNGASLLGFKVDGPTDGEFVVAPQPDESTEEMIAEFNSGATPIMEATNSIFVSLKNIRVKSYNANKTARSQILYQIPRFDNSGTDAGGGLYFEPHERLYISCNNPEPLNINAFELNMVNHDETLARDLVGRTVVCLHFRQGNQDWYAGIQR